jgi:hypothetical protein
MKSPSPEEQGETLTRNGFQSVNPAVIPGRAQARSPESIAPVINGDCGLADARQSGMTDEPI